MDSTPRCRYCGIILVGSDTNTDAEPACPECAARIAKYGVPDPYYVCQDPIYVPPYSPRHREHGNITGDV